MSLTEIAVDWRALEDAFENNAAEVHSYLHLITGEVVRVVDGVADPALHARIANSNEYLRIEAVPSREQYRWMESYIETISDDELADVLTDAIDGKGAFRRFKDALARFPSDRERWFEYRSARLRECMVNWLETKGLKPVERIPEEAVQEVLATHSSTRELEELSPEREHLITLVMDLRERHIETATALLEFLQVRAMRKKHGLFEEEPDDDE